jgi:shikimate kinase
MKTPIILIGPISAGKTSVAECLAHRLSLPQISMDVLRTDYYLEVGYDEELAQQKRNEGGWWERYRYWKPFEAHAVARILADHPVGVIDFGAGHSVYEDEQLFQRVADILAPYPFIFLLLPSADVAESVKILASRDETAQQLAEVNEHFLRHHSNGDLAKFIVYTKDKTPLEICDELLALLNATTDHF